MINRELLFFFVSIALIAPLSLALAAEDEELSPPPIELEEQLDAIQPEGDINELLYEALENVIDEEYEVAIPKLEYVIEQRPTSMPAWESLGWAYWNIGRREDAVRLWRDLLRLDPDIPQAYNLLAMAASANDNLDEAQTYYQRSLELDPDQFHPRLSLAKIYRWQGHLEPAIEQLEALLQDDPDRLDVRLELARALLQNWRYEKAAPHWETLLAASPDNSEYLMAMATVHLNNDRPEEAMAVADQLLELNPDHIGALTLLADVQEYGEDPAEALPTLRRLIDLAEEPDTVQQFRTRLVRLHVRLHERDPGNHVLTEAIQVANDMAEADPQNVDTRLLLGELNSMAHRFPEAEQHLLYVLEHMNPNNQRAHRGLFEVYLGQRDHDKAWEQFEIIEAFNPNDPYLNYRRARFEAGRGRFYAAHEALDELERRGRQGAVAVLLYHALSPSDWTSTPSQRRLLEQLNALKEAGYRFITVDELPAYFAQAAEREEGDEQIDKVVMVTFDDALRSSMEYGTEVAEMLDARFTQFVITGYTEHERPFISTWPELKMFERTGRWSFQSQLYMAEERRPIDEAGTEGLPLANRLWLPDEQRHETLEEYQYRVSRDYALSHELLQLHFEQETAGMAVAYPLGEIGQETASNVEGAIPFNLAQAAEHYEMGFIQTPFGHAVQGDTPYLYQRHELHRSDEGPQALAHVMSQHPVLLAERLRAEFAALQGKARQATRSLRNLEDAGYPEESLERVETYVENRMTRRFDTPTAADTARAGFFSIELSEPFVGARTRYFRDNLGRRNWFQGLAGGLNLTPRLTVEGQAGIGQLTQNESRPNVDGEPQPDIDLDVDETHVGVRSSLVISDRSMISAEAAQRDFSGDASWSPLTYAVEAFFRPFITLDTYFRYEHDVVESAFSITQEVEQDMIAGNAILHLLDWWDIWVSGAQYDFSDDNDRQHLTLVSQWLLSERIGLYVGLRYGYVTASEQRIDYWTPYELNRYYVEALLRKSYLNIYYNIGARIGVGKQSVSPEARAAFAETVARAERLQFDPGEAPSEDYETIVGLLASARIDWGEHWELTGEVSHNRLPDYEEWNASAAITYTF